MLREAPLHPHQMGWGAVEEVVLIQSVLARWGVWACLGGLAWLKGEYSGGSEVGKLFTIAFLALIGAILGEIGWRLGLPVNQTSGASGGALATVVYFVWGDIKPSGGSLAGCLYMLFAAAVIVGFVVLAWWTLTA